MEGASRKGAPPDVVKALRGIPAKQYANREEVALDALHHVPGARPVSHGSSLIGIRNPGPPG
ncbi:DUF2795 domain-containing protein [Streptomyces parvulus]|uniref:DUF2795 domain-containing protein n=1 Tax=Streptomyces parvulus TaxID=146923 RepID=UPI00215D86EB|nr:DUF2795 domain-containing protein [Streptomyces parvulus]